jgi:nucleotide-binding universal stress UspA family protein
MFRRILVGLDGSPLGQLAFQTALELACRYRAKLIALSVVEEPARGNHEHDETERQQFYCQVQTNACAQARAAGITLQTVIRRGHAARALVECAQEVEANPIILGATGHKHPWSLTMGGTVWRVIGDTTRAVMVIRPPRTARWVRDIMVHHVSTVTPQTPLAEVVGLFLRHGMKKVTGS